MNKREPFPTSRKEAREDVTERVDVELGLENVGTGDQQARDKRPIWGCREVLSSREGWTQVLGGEAGCHSGSHRAVRCMEVRGAWKGCIREGVDENRRSG